MACDAVAVRRPLEHALGLLQQVRHDAPLRHLAGILEPRRAHTLGQLESRQRIGGDQRLEHAPVQCEQVTLLGQTPGTNLVERLGDETG
jgi:hypothetical protein